MRKLTTQEFIDRSIQVHGDRYNYDKTQYIDRRHKVVITCTIHGDFDQDTCSHMNGNGCPECVGVKRHTNDTFINISTRVHNNKYNYSLVEYTNNKTKVSIICPIHGIFEQTPDRHLKGNGCKKCADNTPTLKQIIEKFGSIHHIKYDYSSVDYINTNTKVKIICPIHGEFEQYPYLHLKGNGCPECGILSTTSTSEIFINKSTKIHNNKYDYSLIEYINSKKKVKIICPIHGIFEQKPNDHINGHGCPKCVKSISNQEISLQNFIKSIYPNKIISNTRSIITPLELDIYLPEINKAFEYNGRYWHEEGITKPIGYHQMKTDMCESKGIQLIHIEENDWINDREFMENYIIRIIS